MSHGTSESTQDNQVPDVESAEPDAGEGDLDGLKKVTILMTRSLHQEMKTRARKRGVTITELMRRAIALDCYLDDAQRRGSVVQVRTGDDIERLTLL